jgi:uncharacterized membrane protein
MIKKVVLAVALGIIVLMVLSMTQLGPRNPETKIPVNSPTTYPNLGDLWNGNAYFERQSYTPAPDCGGVNGGCTVSEESLIAGPRPNEIYMYYRPHLDDKIDTITYTVAGVQVTVSVKTDGGVSLASSTDGGVTFHQNNGGHNLSDLGPGSASSSGCAWDSQHVIAPSVVKVGGTYYMVYEGATIGYAAAYTYCPPGFYYTSGDIGLATSTDGVTWQKHGIILYHSLDPTSWEFNNIGTPFVGYFNNQFYVFYHGDSGVPYVNQRNQIGMASGPDLYHLTKHGDPVLRVGVGLPSWDAWVTSRASVIWDAASGYYYMTFEGSQNAQCNTVNHVPIGNWGWGIARTQNLDTGTWDQYPYNPIRQTYQGGCANDLPYIFQFGGAIRVYQSDPGQANILLAGSDPYLHVYQAASQCSTYHNLGGPTTPASEGWQATTSINPFFSADYMCFGPYETGLPTGKYTVSFRGLIDTILGVPLTVFTVDINDHTSGGTNVQATMDVNRLDFVGGNTYQNFILQFSATSGHSYEWRTKWYNQAYTKLNVFFVRQLDGSVDITAPTSSVSSLPANSPTPFSVSWSGSDNEAHGTGIWSFDIQYRVYGGTWTDLNYSTAAACCIGTTATSFSFPGQCFNTYGFQARARDNSGIVGSYPNSPQATTYVACDFGISASPASLTFNSGSSGSSSISLNPLNGFSGSINLAVSSILPSTGLSCSLDSTTVFLGASGNANLSCGGSSPGTYNVTVTGTGGPVSHSAMISVQVKPFSISASPSSLFQQAGGPSRTVTLTITSGTSFSGTLTLSATASPAGPSTSLNPITVTLLAGGTATSTLTISTAASTTPGVYSVIVTGTSGTFSSSTSVGLQVTVPVTYLFPATFTQTGGVSGSNVIALVGTPVSISTTIASTGPVSGTVSAEIVADSGWPFILTVQVNTIPVTLNAGLNTVNLGSFTPTVLTSPIPLTVHDYYIRVDWNGLSIYNPDFAPSRETVQTTLQEFTMYANPTSLSFLGSATAGTSTITITSVNFFSGTVFLSVSSSPTGLSCFMTLTAVNPTTTSNLICSGAPGTYTVVVTGTSGSMTRLVSIPVTVYYRDLAITSLKAVGTFSRGVVTLSALVLNNGTNPESSVSVTFNVNSILIGTVTSNTPLGAGQTVPVNITWNATNLPLGSFTLNAHVEPTIYDVNTGNNDIAVAGSVSDSSLSYNGYTGDVYGVLVGGPSGTMTMTLVNSAGVTARGTVPISFISTKFVAELPTSPFWLGAVCNIGVSGTSGCILGKTLDVAYQGNSHVDIVDLSTMAIAYGSTTSSPNWNPAADLNNDGVINIIDLAQLAANYGSPVVQFAAPIVSLSAQPATITFPAGSSTTTAINVNSLNGFTGTISLTATSAPSGPTCTSASVTLTAGGSSTATLTCSGTTAGIFAITVGGSNGILGNFVEVHLTISDFAVSASQTTASFVAGTSAPITVTLSSINGFSGTVNLSASPTSPVSTSCPTSITLASNNVSVVCTFNSSTGGTYPMTITGTGSISHSTTVTVNVQDFTIAASPSTVSFNSGTSGSTSLTLVSIGTFSGNVTLTAPAPSGLQVTCTPNVTLVSGGTAPASCTFSSTTPGTYVVTVSGSGSGRTHSATITVNVGDFSISATPASQSIFKGSSTTATISLSSLYSFSGTITLTVSVSPQFNSPPSVSVNPISVTISSSSPGTATVNFSTFNSTTKTTYTVTVTATSGSIVHTTTFAVTVN